MRVCEFEVEPEGERTEEGGVGVAGKSALGWLRVVTIFEGANQWELFRRESSDETREKRAAAGSPRQWAGESQGHCGTA